MDPGLAVGASGRGEPVEEDEPLHIVDEGHQADLGCRPGGADGADEELHLVLLHGEDVLDLGADFRFERVGDVEKSRLSTHRFVPRPHQRENQKSAERARFLEASSSR